MEPRKRRMSFTTALASALFEWLLIFMLLVYGIFGYIITKFARYCELPIPCLLCSRIDHIVGSGKVRVYQDMICKDHKLEISSLVLCNFHEKLVDVCGMCETCLFSFATKDKSNAETYRLLVGKLGTQDIGGFKEDSLLDDNKPTSSSMKHCSCCNELWTSRSNTQRLLQTRSIGFDASDFELPLTREFWGKRENEEKTAQFLAPERTRIERKTEEDSPAHFGYSELKITSDSESEIRVSDNEDSAALISNDPLRDLILDSTPMDPFITISEENYFHEKMNMVVLSMESSQILGQVQSDVDEPHLGPSVASALSVCRELEELNLQEIDPNIDPSGSTNPEKVHDAESSDSGNVSVNISENGSDIQEAAAAQVQETDKTQELDISKITTDRNSSKISSDNNEAAIAQVQETDKTLELEISKITADLRSSKMSSGNNEAAIAQVQKTDKTQELEISKITTGLNSSKMSSDNNEAVIAQVQETDKTHELEITKITTDLNSSKMSSDNNEAAIAQVQETDKTQELEITKITTDLNSSKMSSDNNEATIAQVQETDKTQELEISKITIDLNSSKMSSDNNEAAIAQVQETDKTQESEISKNTTNLNGSKMSSDNNEGGMQLQIPNLDLVDAYKLAVSSKGRQMASKLSEQLAGNYSPRFSEDLKLLLSQFSRGIESPGIDIPNPMFFKNIDDLKTYDSSTSVGMKLLQKRLSLERYDSRSSLDRNESGFESVDFSAVSEVEGESELDRLKRQLEYDRKFMTALVKELEEERNASAIAANEAMAMITRLQEEKSALQMEASQGIRIMEDKAEYDMEALDKLNELVGEKDIEIQDLEAELEYFRTKYPNKSFSENEEEMDSNVSRRDKIMSDSDLSNVERCDHGVDSGDLEANSGRHSKHSLLEIEDEREYISRCLRDLEKKLNLLSSNGKHKDSIGGDHLEKQGGDSKLHEQDDQINEADDNNIISQIDASVSKVNLHKEADIVALAYELCNLSERLQAIEADKSFIERAINTLKNGEEGLIQEIASHLRELRRIGIRRFQALPKD